MNAIEVEPPKIEVIIEIIIIQRMTFHDRDEELEALERAVDEQGHACFVVYGRRRVGKTALLKEFCAGRPHVYYLAAQEAEHRQREKFVEQIAAHFEDRVPEIDGWDDALDYLAENLTATDEPRVIVLDEFPYLVAENDALPSYVQGFVDNHLQHTESMLVLCGSSVSTMESDVLGHESPLFGRRTGQVDLQPFSFRTAREVITYDVGDAIPSYAVTGGTPMYLTLFDYDRSLAANITDHVLSPTSVLYNEPEFLLRSELRNPARYRSILEAVALGHTTPNEIAGAAGIEAGPLSKYLQTLRRLRLLDREVPVTATEKNSKRSRYRVGDEFFRFWFRFVEPNRSGIEEAPEVVFEERIEPALPTHVSRTFEHVCREAIWAGVRTSSIEPYADIGAWWYGEAEIDIVGIGPAEDRLLCGECKWTTEPVGYGLAEELRGKTEEVRWGPETRDIRYMLFSKSGFVEGLAEDLGDAWRLFDLEDIDRLLCGE